MNNDIRQQIKKITIYTKRIMQSTLSGDYVSAFKGSGLDFDQLREYQMGDDVRFIDWNCSAKSNKLMIKQFIEERDRTVILAIDVSASSHYSSNHELRSQTIAQVASALAFIATHNKDKVGALFFSDTVEKWIPPNRGKSHYAQILEALCSLTPKNKKTSIQAALHFLLSLKQRNAILFMLSDWIDEIESYEKLLKVARFKFDFIGVRLLDQCEHELPSFGMLDLQDPETGELVTIDTRAITKTFLHARQLEQNIFFKKQKIDLLDLIAGKSFVNSMVKFFHQRTRKQVR